MKGKFLKMVSGVMLSAFLAVTMSVFPSNAAVCASVDPSTCEHSQIYAEVSKEIYINAISQSHQVAQYMYGPCVFCGTKVSKTYILRSEPHSFDGNGVCTLCRYRDH